MKAVLGIVAVVALIGVLGLLADSSVTGMSGRAAPPKLKALPDCPNGCYWGDPMVISGQKAWVSKNDFAFESCNIPEKPKGCYPDRTTLYPYAFKESHIGMITCENHAWIMPLSLYVPCPPEPAKLS